MRTIVRSMEVVVGIMPEDRQVTRRDTAAKSGCFREISISTKFGE